MFVQKKLLVRVSEAAHLLSVSQACIKRLIASGTLPAVWIERSERVPLAALESFAAHPPEKHRKRPSFPICDKQTSALVAFDVGDRVNPSNVVPPGSIESLNDCANRFVLPQMVPATVASAHNEEERTVANLITEWLREAQGRVRPRTYASYAQMARLHIVPELGSLTLKSVDIRTIEAFLRSKHESGLSSRTVLYVRAILHQAFQDALRWDWVSRNVISLTRGPKHERNLIEILSLEESRRLLASFHLSRHGSLFATALGLGLRFGEVLGLRWQDVTLSEDGKSGQITVRVQLQRINQQIALVPPKSRSGVRTLALPAFVVRALMDRRRIEAEERRVAAHSWVGGDWGLVFSNQKGCPLDESRIRKRFREHLIQQGFPPMRFHDLRHLCASLLIAQGTSPRAVMEILGHSQISLTMDTYSHVIPCVHQAAAKALDAIFYPQRVTDEKSLVQGMGGE